MYFQHGTIVFSPSDLTRFMESPFASWMDRRYLEFPEQLTPDESSDELQLYSDAGITHEAAFVKELETQGNELCWIKGDDRKKTAAATQQAIILTMRLQQCQLNWAIWFGRKVPIRRHS